MKNTRNLKFAVLLLAIIFLAIYFRSHKKEYENTTQNTEKVSNNFLEKESVAKDRPPTEKTPSPPKVSQPVVMSIEEIEKLRSSAKANLAALYTASRAYFAEYDRYSTDLEALGWSPAEPILKYKIGFIEPYIPTEYRDSGQHREDPRRMDTDSLINKPASDSQAYSYDPAVEEIQLSQYESYCLDKCTASAEHFEIMVAIPMGDKDHVDIWVTNEKKEMKLVKDAFQK